MSSFRRLNKVKSGKGFVLASITRLPPYLHSKTEDYVDLIGIIVAEVRALKRTDFKCSSIQLGHDTSDVSPPNRLPGSTTLCMTVGEYAGGRVRLEGGKQPLYIRDHAVIFDGATPFT